MDSHKELNTNWRKVAATIYKKPVDSKIYGTVDLDVTDIEKYIARKRKQGVKTTLTYLLTLITGRSIRNGAMELNTYVRRGKIIQREQIDAVVSVLLPGGQMSSIKVENTDKLSVAEFSREVSEQIAATRNGKENIEMQSKGLLSALPWPFRNWLFNIYRTLTVGWGLSFPGLNLSANSFGSYVVSNIGTVGLDTGYGSLFPASNISFVLILGSIIKKPVVKNGEIVIRNIMKLSATLDHRVVDGSHGGKLFRGIKYYVQNPELLDDL